MQVEHPPQQKKHLNVFFGICLTFQVHQFGLAFTNMPIHSIWTCSNTFYTQYGCGKKWVVLYYGLNHVNMSLFHSHHVPQDHHNPGHLGRYHSVRKHPYAYSQHMNVLKHSLYIQYGCGEERSGIEQTQPCQHTIILIRQPQPKSGSTWRAVHQCKGVLICISTSYECAQTLSIDTIWMWRTNGWYFTTSIMSTHHYFTPLSLDYPNWVNLTSSVTMQGCTHMPLHSIWMSLNTLYIYNMDV